MAATIYATIGISGSGKSKFTKYIKDALQAVEVNADKIRREYGDLSDQSQNDKVWKEVDRRTTALLAGGINVILSNTNLHKKSVDSLRNKYIYNDVVLFIMEDSNDIELCWKRIQTDLLNNVERSNVPREVLEKQSENFQRVIKELESYPLHYDNVKIFTVNNNFRISSL